MRSVHYLTESFFQVVLQKSTPLQIRQLILYHFLLKKYADGFVWIFFSAKRLAKHSV